MAKKQRAPDPPDYSDLIEATKQAAQYSYDLGKEQLEWAKEAYGQDRAIAQQVIDAALARQAANDADARKDRQRYETVFQPLEDQLVAEANEYNTEGRREMEAGRAAAGVAESFEAARRAAAQNLESFGVDPTSTRFAALDAASRVSQAAATAAASDEARRSVEDTARGLRSEALQIGQMYPSNIATTSSTSLQSGNQGVNSGIATTGSGANTMGTAPGWQTIGNSAIGGWGDILNAQYNNQLAQYNANQQSSSGIGAALGGIAGLIGSSSNAAGATGLGMFLADGGAIPEAASPSRGKAVDDVPARLSAGEFVIPKDVLSWKGEEFFQKLIEGSRKARPAAPAQPQRGALPVERPRFVSNSALPVAA